jgi:hypothetical protein
VAVFTSDSRISSSLSVRFSSRPVMLGERSYEGRKIKRNLLKWKKRREEKKLTIVIRATSTESEGSIKLTGIWSISSK